MKLFLSSSVALSTFIIIGKRLEGSNFISRMGRRKMATIALSLATIDVIAVGGVFFGGVAWCLDASDPYTLAKGMRRHCEDFMSPMREWKQDKNI